ncbi:MAG: SGNH/GDSL hydrolase family protein [Steroidobacteraceae bacterium]
MSRPGLAGRRLLQLLVLSAISVIFALILAETLLHLFPRILPIELQVLLGDDLGERGVADARIGNLPEPGSTGVIWTNDFRIEHRIDAHGFRNSRPWPEAADIIVIGDSLVFGYGVEADRAWPEVLGKELPGRSVVNLGLIGAGPQQYRRIYDTFGERLRPRLVVIGMFASNDFWDAEMFEDWLASGVGGNYLEWRDFRREPEGVELRWPLRSLRNVLRRESYVYNLLRFTRQAWRSKSGNGHTVLLENEIVMQLSPASVLQRMQNTKPPNAVFDIVLESIQAIHDAATADGAGTLVVLQPSKEKVYLPLIGESSPDASSSLREYLAQRQIEFLDLTPAFQRRLAAEEPLFFPNDGHPNEAGYSLIAREVAAYIVRGELLDAGEATK